MDYVTVGTTFGDAVFFVFCLKARVAVDGNLLLYGAVEAGFPFVGVDSNFAYLLEATILLICSFCRCPPFGSSRVPHAGHEGEQYEEGGI